MTSIHATPTATADGALDIRHVVVPLDGSSFAAAALPTAQAIADHFGADLSTMTATADPAEAISARARAGAGTLVVMSTRARGRLHGALVRSVATDVLASGQPFIAVGPNADRPGWLTGRPRRRPSNWPGPLSKGDVVVAVDGTVEAESAVAIAARWATTLDRELVVLTVTTDEAAGPREAPPADVHAIAERAAAITPRSRGEVVRDPIGVASGIRRHLAEHDVALLVLATAHRTGLDRLRRGARAADIVRTSTVPTLVVPVRAASHRPASATAPGR